MTNDEKILYHLEKYCNLLSKVFPEESVENFVSDFGERLALCPRGLEKGAGGTAGELVSFSLNVAQKSKELAAGMCDVRSSVRVALVHELGRLGDLEEELYHHQESSWHQEKLNQFYKYNPKCKKMNLAHRTLYLLQKYNFPLTQDEWISIAVSQGMHLPENSFYGQSAGALTALIQFSRSLVLDSNS